MKKLILLIFSAMCMSVYSQILIGNSPQEIKEIVIKEYNMTFGGSFVTQENGNCDCYRRDKEVHTYYFDKRNICYMYALSLQIPLLEKTVAFMNDNYTKTDTDMWTMKTEFNTYTVSLFEHGDYFIVFYDAIKR